MSDQSAEAEQAFTCLKCGDDGYTETCRADGEQCRRSACDCDAGYDWNERQEQLADRDSGPAFERAVDAFRDGSWAEGIRRSRAVLEQQEAEQRRSVEAFRLGDEGAGR